MAFHPFKAPSSENPLSGANTVCVIDSDPAIRDSLASYLGLLGQEVICFPGLGSFREAWQPDQPCVVLCAALLDDGRGTELFRWLKSCDGAPPFALTLSRHDHEQLRRARAAGIQRFLFKPLLSSAELMSFIGEAPGTHR